MSEKQIAILFSDISGFTSLSFHEYRLFATIALSQISKVITEHAPIVKNTWGDATFMIFETADSAAECALSMRDVIKNTNWQKKGFSEPLGMRIALHNAAAQILTDPITKRLNAYGAHVNQAARLEPKVLPNEVFATTEFVTAFNASSPPTIQCRRYGLIELAKSWGTADVYVLRRKDEQPLPRLKVANLIEGSQVVLKEQVAKSVGAERRRFQRVNERFKAFAINNAVCDRKLFDKLGLFMFDDMAMDLGKAQSALTLNEAAHQRKELKNLIKRVQESEALRLNALRLAKKIIVNNIRDAIDSTRDIMGAYTETKCASCLKILQFEPRKRVAELHVLTPYRDRLSSKVRTRKKHRGDKVSANTITQKIFCDEMPEWGRDNLKLEQGYENTRGNFLRYYNATLGVGVKAILNSRIPYCAVLCVDNKEGGFNDELGYGLIFEISQRISIMLYRLYVLNSALKSKEYRA